MTDQTGAHHGPAIILVNPQLGENIGAAARVMANFGLSDLRLVAPRDGWPNAAAEPMSAGAFEAGVEARVFDTLDAAVSDITFLLATTARLRDMQKPVTDAAGGAAQLAQHQGQGGVLFGAEQSGLPNESVVLSDAIMTYPVNSDFSSLNLAQAVGVFAHAWAAGQDNAEALETFEAVEDQASRADLTRMFEHFEMELERAGFFFPPQKTDLMKGNLRNAFIRGQWTAQEVRTFRGAIKALALGRGKARIDRED